MSEILLQTKALTKQYGHQKAVDNVDIHIKKGAIYGFIGRNGAGKTTCMRMIGGLAKPTSGEISMFGYAGKDLSKVRSRVGCLIEARCISKHDGEGKYRDEVPSLRHQ